MVFDKQTALIFELLSPCLQFLSKGQFIYYVSTFLGVLEIGKLHKKCHEGSDERTPRRRRTYFEGERRESTEAKQGHKTLVYTAV